MKIKYPDYNNSILNIACSILNHYKLNFKHNTLPYLDNMLKNNYKNIVLMVLDGMGSEIITTNLQENSFLRKHFFEDISSVFPPTTTAATTSLQSGLSPLEHGWLGWNLYFKEINKNVDIYINTDDNGEIVSEYNIANKFIPFKDIIDLINENTDISAHSVSPFGTCKVDTLQDFIWNIRKICNNKDNNYIYAYWPEPDSTMHLHGCHSKNAKSCLLEINNYIENLSKNLEDTLLIITADHGHIDAKAKLILDYPELLSTLERLPSIEARSLNFFVKNGMETKFIYEFNKLFKDDFILLTKEEVLEKELFGTGNESPKFKDFLGDFLAISTSNTTIFKTEQECKSLIGVHAGITESEMMVPLIIVKS